MQGIFQKENTDKALKYGIYRHLPTYEKIIRNLVSFFIKNVSYTYHKGKKNPAMPINKGFAGFIISLKLFPKEVSSNQKC